MKNAEVKHYKNTFHIGSIATKRVMRTETQNILFLKLCIGVPTIIYGAHTMILPLFWIGFYMVAVWFIGFAFRVHMWLKSRGM